MARRIIAPLIREFYPNRLLPSLSMGTVAATLVVMIQISFALLIFSGPLAEHVGAGIGVTLFAGVMLGLAVALGSSLPGMAAVPQDSPAAVLALVAAAIAASMPPSTSAESLLATVIAAIALTSLLTGVAFVVLGWLRQGRLVRYIPYPVIGGFLAGTGWLLFQGGMGVMTDASLSLAQLPTFFQADLMLRWLPGLILAAGLLLILRRFSHFLIMPAILLGAIAFFYVGLWLTGTPMAQVRAAGWLLGPFPEGALWQPLRPSLLAQVHWPAVVGQFGNAGTILVISVVSLLLNASGVELVARRDVDLNRELKAAGLGNILAGLGGGPPGYHALSISALSYRTGAPSRLIGIWMALLSGLLLLVGTTILSYFPKVVLGALILFLGLSFLVEWLYDAWFKLSKADYAVVWVILVAMSTIGVLEGVGLGLALAVVLFIVDYSRVGVVRHAFSGQTYRSNVDRPRLHEGLLRAKGDWLYILELQGFLFFGTAHSLLDRLRARIGAEDRFKTRFVVLDFRRVRGMDASAALGFAKMVQLAQTQGFTLVLTQLSPPMRRQLQREALTTGEGTAWRIFPDLDHGVEWCEEQMIDTFAQVGLVAKKPKTLMRRLVEYLEAAPRFAGWQAYPAVEEEAPRAEPDAMRGVLPFMERLEVEAGEVLIRQGEPPRGLYFVESGQVTIQLEGEDGPATRLRTRGESAIVGEMGLYAGSPASATVVVDAPGVLYYLSTENLARMEAEAPELAAAFHKFIARHLSERLSTTTQTLQVLLE